MLSRRLVDAQGRFAGVVSGVIDLDTFHQFYRQIKLGTRSAILLFSDDCSLVVREAPLADRVGKTFPALVRGRSGPGATRMVSPVDGVRRFVAGAHTDGFPLSVTIAREEAAVFEPPHTLRHRDHHHEWVRR